MSSRVIMGKMTIPTRDYDVEFYQRQLERRLKRHKKAKRVALIKEVISYSFGAASLLALWIVTTGLYG